MTGKYTLVWSHREARKVENEEKKSCLSALWTDVFQYVNKHERIKEKTFQFVLRKNSFSDKVNGEENITGTWSDVPSSITSHVQPDLSWVIVKSIIAFDLFEVGLVGKIFTHPFSSIHSFNRITLLLLFWHNHRECLALKSPNI